MRASASQRSSRCSHALARVLRNMRPRSFQPKSFQPALETFLSRSSNYLSTRTVVSERCGSLEYNSAGLLVLRGFGDDAFDATGRNIWANETRSPSILVPVGNMPKQALSQDMANILVCPGTMIGKRTAALHWYSSSCQALKACEPASREALGLRSDPERRVSAEPGSQRAQYGLIQRDSLNH